MLIAAIFAVTIAAAPTTPEYSMPPLVVNVAAASSVSPALVSALLAETNTIWQSTGITFLWRFDRIAAPMPYGRSTLRVWIGNETHGASSEPHVPLGWIMFATPTSPAREIYVSYANAAALLASSPGVVGAVDAMPRLQRETLLARAMGRALAHELGHYLSASKAHSKTGLMMAVHSAAELFSPQRGRFTIAPAERQQMVARFTSIYMASRG